MIRTNSVSTVVSSHEFGVRREMGMTGRVLAEFLACRSDEDDGIDDEVVIERRGTA